MTPSTGGVSGQHQCPRRTAGWRSVAQQAAWSFLPLVHSCWSVWPVCLQILMILFHFFSLLLISVNFSLISSPGTVTLSGKTLWVYLLHPVACVDHPSAPWALPKALGLNRPWKFCLCLISILISERRAERNTFLFFSLNWAAAPSHCVAEQGQVTRAWKWKLLKRAKVSLNVLSLFSGIY